MAEATLFPSPYKSSAVLSDCGCYRFSLTRIWDDALPVFCWGMCNPSTADAFKNDNTITKIISFTRRLGGGGLTAVNVSPLRATDPAELKRVGRLPEDVMQRNDVTIRVAAEGRRFIAAWGIDGTIFGLDRRLMAVLGDRPVECLRLTKDGHPWHPLYVPYSVAPQPFKMPEVKRAVVKVEANDG